MTTILAIDPGCTESAYCIIDGLQPATFGKVPNAELLAILGGWGEDTALPRDCDHYAIEMVASYGMAVGAEVFETCVWVGRFQEAIRRESTYGRTPDLVKRQPVKLHHCHDSKAKDSNIIQALVDRFALGQPNRGKGTKASPGWFYGFRADIWQAYALAVYVADTKAPTPGEVPF